MSEISIKGLSKAALLAALYNHSRPMGMGMLRARHGNMSHDEAAALIADPSQQDNGSRGSRLRFDYVNGRPLKVDLTDDTLHTGLYNRDNGPGAAEAVVEALRARGGQ